MHKKRELLLFSLLTILLFALRLPSLAEPLDNDSGSVAFFAREMLRGNILYDQYHPTHHLPGVYYTFLVAFQLFGDTPSAPKLFLFPWTLACAWLVYKMGRSYLNEYSGTLGAIFFILLSSQVLMKGTTVEMEQFANLPLTAGVFLAMILINGQAPAWKFIWVGLLSAVCILYKVIFIAPLAVAGLTILVVLWVGRKKADVWKSAFACLVWMAVGLIVPLVAVGFYFASLGLWERFLLVFTIGFGYIKSNGMFAWLPPPFGYPLLWLGVNNAALLLFGLLGAYRCGRQVFPWQPADTKKMTNLMLVFWFIVSFAEAGLRRGGWEHYALLVVPPLSLMAAFEITVAHGRWKSITTEYRALLGACLMTGLVVFIFLAMNFNFYSHYVAYKLGAISRAQFIHGYGGTSGTGPDALNAELIGQYIQAHTVPGDQIYLATESVQAYYYADRQPPVDILWPDYLFVTGSGDRIFTPRVKYIVLDSPEKIEHPAWLMTGLQQYYYVETVIGGQEIYRRQAP